jgi:hypothetical protein
MDERGEVRQIGYEQNDSFAGAIFEKKRSCEETVTISDALPRFGTVAV